MSLKLSAGGDTQGSAGSAASFSALQCWLCKQGLGLLLQPPPLLPGEGAHLQVTSNIWLMTMPRSCFSSHTSLICPEQGPRKIKPGCC